MIQKNSLTEVTAVAYNSDGDGVCRKDGFVIFVPGLMVGERAEVLAVKVKKTYAYGKLIRLLEASPERIASDCDAFPRCGGCALRHMSYREELRFKKQLVEDALTRIGGLSVRVAEPVPSPQILHYRNKAQLPVREENGEARIGFYAARSHRLVDCRGCKLQQKRTDAICDALKTYMKQTGASAYCEKTGQGLIRHLYLRVTERGQMVCVVTNGKKLPDPDLFCRLMTEAAGEGTTVVQNINRDATNVVLGREMICLQGDGTVCDSLCGLEFRISPHSFYQINHAQTEQLYRKAAELAAVTAEETVLDLYCGIGTMTLLFAKTAKKAYGIEIVEQAVKNASENAARNGIENAEFLCGDAAFAVERLNGERIDAVVLDPPRGGCAEELIDAVVRIAPKRIVYVSCNPATLARDLKSFAAYGYAASEAFPFDMFPRTAHVESVVLLSKATK